MTPLDFFGYLPCPISAWKLLLDGHSALQVNLIILGIEVDTAAQLARHGCR